MQYPSHEEFINKYRNKEISVGVDKVKSHALVESAMPKRYRYASLFWGWIAMLLFLGGIISFFVWNWKIAIIEIILSIVTFNATRKSNYQFVLTYALENAEFYKLCIENGALTINNVSNNSDA